MTDHAEIDLEVIKRHRKDGSNSLIKDDDFRSLIAAVGALRDRVAELEGAQIVNRNAIRLQRERAEAAEATPAKAVERARAKDGVITAAKAYILGGDSSDELDVAQDELSAALNNLDNLDALDQENGT